VSHALHCQIAKHMQAGSLCLCCCILHLPGCEDRTLFLSSGASIRDTTAIHLPCETLLGNSVIKWCLRHEQNNTTCHCCISVHVQLTRLLNCSRCTSHLPAFLFCYNGYMLAQQAVCMLLLTLISNVMSSDHASNAYLQDAVSYLCDTITQVMLCG